MHVEEIETCLSGQERVREAWRRRLLGRQFIHREDFNAGSVGVELAHLSILACENGRFRFRLAGSGVRAAFGCEARGLSAAEIDICRGSTMWTELAAKALARLAPVSGRTRLPDGTVHYWLRLPMSSDGVMADQVLCHDRYLPAESLDDPEAAARAADAALRLDGERMAA
ncbi:MAG: PAS domain-containing protein [Hyphomonadaceae bacterium]|nr:PAS domain-containing protein [Hyphomonadaceae bacterium]